MPGGTNDMCAPPSGKGSGSCQFGDGLYCGGNGVPGDPDKLYQCTSGNVSLVEICANSCLRMPGGENDLCSPVAGGGKSGGRCVNGDGLYCGGNGVNGDSGTLYQCTAGNVTVAQVCANGCQREPAGINDKCAPTGGGKGSGNRCLYGDGLYCGGNGVNGDPGTLYRCTAGSVSVVQACGNGCQRMPPGVNDQCTSGPGSCPSGNGLYCGGDGVNGDPNTLYNCNNGNLTVLQACANGCQRMPAGVNDQCAAGKCVNGDGLYCGGDGVTGDPGTLYRCTAGDVSLLEVCGHGCQRMPAGVDDQCAPPSCPFGDGLYCGGDGVSGDPGTLYRCSGGTLTVAQACSIGCQREPAGVNDQCAGSNCGSGNGLYCGANGVNGDPNTLYLCTNGAVTVSQVCANGCQRMPPGVNDLCATTPAQLPCMTPPVITRKKHGAAHFIALTGASGWSTIPEAISSGTGAFTITNGGVGSFGGWSATACAAKVPGDFNGDGVIDIALTGVPGWSTIPVATSIGGGNFSVTNSGVGAFAGWVTTAGVKVLVGDFNGDGKDDIALTGGSGWSTIPVATSTGGGNFTITNNSVGDFATLAAGGAVAVVGDFNGDGKADIALTGGAGWTTIPVATSTGGGNFIITNNPVGGFATWAAVPGVKVVVGDFNGDGKDDIALLGGTGWDTIPVASSLGQGKFNITNGVVGDFATWAATPGVKVVVADFNGDGKDDIALIGVPGWTTIPVATSIGNGNFTITNSSVGDFAAWAATPGVKILVGDFNGDGKDDIALTGPSGWGSIPVATSAGNGNFTITNNPVPNFATWAATPGAVAITGFQK